MGKVVNSVVKGLTFGSVDDVTGLEATQDAQSGAAAQQQAAINRALDLSRSQFDQSLGFQQQQLDRSLAAQELGRANSEALLSPFSRLTNEGLAGLPLLTSGTAQLDFLQNSPLFQLGLQNLNEQTQKSAAAQGRLSAGDTLGHLQNNALLAGLPVLQNQQGIVQDLLSRGFAGAQARSNAAQGFANNASNLNTGFGVNASNLATGFGQTQGGLLQNLGNVNAASILAPQQAENQLNNQLLQLGSQAAGALIASDRRLKRRLMPVGVVAGHTVYTWLWNDKATALGLQGEGGGVVAQEVAETNPDAVSVKDGYLHVDYSRLPQELAGVAYGY